MINYPEINPIAFSIGSLSIHWYGLMYLFGFVGGFFYLKHIGKQSKPKWDTEQIYDLVFYIAIGVILGGKLGYVLFYQPDLILENPFELIKFWERGRSFHGGLIGVIIALYLYSKRHYRPFLEICDFTVRAVPIGLGLGRLGNFINGELWGRVTDMPWGMVVPMTGSLPRHPSQLYQFLLEGVLLFIMLHLYSKKRRRLGQISAMFLILYSLFRIIAEFYREPDWFLGFIFKDIITMGQALSIPMLLLGIWLFRRKNP